MDITGKVSIVCCERVVNYWTTILNRHGNRLNRVMCDIVYDLHNRGLYTSMYKGHFRSKWKKYVWINQDSMFNFLNSFMFLSVIVLNNCGTLLL